MALAEFIRTNERPNDSEITCISSDILNLAYSGVITALCLSAAVTERQMESSRCI